MPDSRLAERVAKSAVGLGAEDATAIRSDLETVQKAGIISVEQLVEAVGDPNRELTIRVIACSLVAELNESSAATALARALEEADDDGLVWEAAKALTRIRPENTAPKLVTVLEQGKPTKQSAAAYVLGWLGVPSTTPALRMAALNPELDVEVRGHAAEALGVIQASDAVPDLITLLSDPLAEVRYWAAYALGEIGDPASIPALEQMASSEVAVLPHGWSLKQEALDALESIRVRGERPE